jgi:hypothetical protein
MNKTKECIMCFSDIDARSKKCPYCTSLQAKFSNLENNPVLIGFLVVLLFGIFGYLFYQSFYVRALEEKAIQDLKVTITEVSTKGEGDSLYVACIGNIKNDTDFTFKEIKFQIDFLTVQNELVDTLSITDEDIELLPNASTNFRVRGVAHKEADAYKQCIVKISDAWSHK